MILDIFAQNARSHEGKAQVELALLRYRLPRLRGPGPRPQPAGRWHRHPGTGRDPARGRPPAPGPAHAPARGRPAPGVERTRRIQRRSRARGRHRRVSLVGYTNAGKSTLLNRLTDAGVLVENRLFATLDPRTRRLALPGGETVLLTDTVGFVRKLPHQLVEAFRSTLEVGPPGRPAGPRGRRLGARPRGPDRGGAGGAGRDRGRATCPSCWCSTRPTASPEAARAGRRDPRARSCISARTGEGIDELLAGHRRPAAGGRPGGRAASSPATGATSWPPSTARARWSSSGHGDEAATGARRARRRRPGPVPPVHGGLGVTGEPAHGGASGRRPIPTTGCGELRPLAEAPARRRGRLSVGTPCDPPPRRGGRALAASGTERGYPPSVGGPALRRAAADWLQRRFEVAIDPSAIGRLRRHQGVRGPAPAVPAPARPRPRHRALPGGLLPDLRHGRRAGRLPGRGRAPGRRRTERARPRRRRRRRRRPGPAALGRTARPTRPGGSTTWPRRPRGDAGTGVPVFSDECYAEFTWDGPAPHDPRSRDLTGVVAVHSLSKRSNLAGVRVGFYAGDPELVTTCGAVRQHAGLMVPGPVQAAAAVALADDDHVDEQRERYRERLSCLAERPRRGRLPGRACRPAASTCGCRCPTEVAATPGPWPRTWPARGGPAGQPGRVLRRAGGRGYVRVAVVQPDGAPAHRGRAPGRRPLALSSPDRAPPAPRRTHRRPHPSRAAVRPRYSLAMADLQAKIEELWGRVGELSPGRHRGVADRRRGHRPARPGRGPGGRGRPGRRGRRPRLAEEGHPAAVPAPGHRDHRARAVRVRRQAAAEDRLRGGRRAGGARRLGPLGLVPRTGASSSCRATSTSAPGSARTPWSTPGPRSARAPRSGPGSTCRAAWASAACSSRPTPPR